MSHSTRSTRSGLKRAPLMAAGLAATLLLGPGLATAQTKQHPDYVAGAAAWTRGDYPQASERLSSYRVNVAYGKSYDVDYMLGTAWCRMAGLARPGWVLLDWALQQEMPPVAAKSFKAELSFCQAVLDRPADAASRTPERLARANLGSGATATARGKAFFVAGGDRGSVGAYPLELVDPRPEAEYESRIYPLTDVDAALKATRARLPRFTVTHQGRFILAGSAQSQANLQVIGRRLTHYLGFLEAQYGIRPPDSLITVQVVPETRDLVELARRVHGIKASPLILGYAFQNDLSVTAVMKTTAAGTLLHELFHLAVRARFGDIPTWLDEGMASLYETSTVVGDDYFGEPNWRGKVIKDLSGSFGRFSLQRLVTWSSVDGVRHRDGHEVFQARPDEAAYIAAMGRYFVMFMQERGKLPGLYKTFMQRPASVADLPAAQASLELISSLMQLPVGALEEDFTHWLDMAVASPDLRFPRTGAATEVRKEIPAQPTPPADGAAGATAGPPPMNQVQKKGSKQASPGTVQRSFIDRESIERN